ncbi:hypothetical protein BDZ94DRAFT_1259704 [Collybia nuda]|uniref:Secreted protein n=1 Tax=Collybia nuda TaxID=64659 RepID=A0A9P5Y8B3_9AGAR|nr:hypothetical protein BDZ94DRAFT_1259704 [Collybia nuda]
MLQTFFIISTFAAVRSLAFLMSNTTTPTVAQCIPEYSWTENSRHFSPCQLATNLLSAFSSDLVVGPLSGDEAYPTPNGEVTQANQSAGWFTIS